MDASTCTQSTFGIHKVVLINVAKLSCLDLPLAHPAQHKACCVTDHQSGKCASAALLMLPGWLLPAARRPNTDGADSSGRVDGHRGHAEGIRNTRLPPLGKVDTIAQPGGHGRVEGGEHADCTVLDMCKT